MLYRLRAGIAMFGIAQAFLGFLYKENIKLNEYHKIHHNYVRPVVG